MFYSNCLIEALKAKIKDPKNVKITYISPFKNKKFQPHFLWSNDKYDYDFGISDKNLKWYNLILFKGEIRKGRLGFNENYKSKLYSRN